MLWFLGILWAWATAFCIAPKATLSVTGVFFTLIVGLYFLAIAVAHLVFVA